MEKEKQHYRILIVGGGIAGITLLHLLSRNGFKPTLIEKAPAWRTIGYAVAIWKVGIDILRKLPLDSSFWSRVHPIKQGSFVDARWSLLSRLDFSALSTDGIGAMIVEREVLHRAIVDILPKDADVRFGTYVKELEQGSKQVKVIFSDSTVESYDLVVGADGIRSQIRTIVFGERLHSYGWGVWGGWSSPELVKTDGNYLVAAPGQFLLTMPGAERSSIALVFRNLDAGRVVAPESCEQILERFDHLREVVAPLAAAIVEPGSLFSDELAQVKMCRWYRGRVVLIGDARHGISLVSGWGTSLALEDAYEFAETLKQSDNIDTALTLFARKRQRVLNRVKHFASMMEYVALAPTRKALLFRKLIFFIMPKRFPQWLMKRASDRSGV